MSVPHTPGPWRDGSGSAIVSDHPDDDDEVLGPDSQKFYDGKVLIAESVAPKNRPLIKAAPKLLAACKRLVSAIMTEQGGADLLPVDKEWDPEHFRVIQEAKAAIAEADGKTP